VFHDFESGSLLLDVGCGDGKYLNINPNVVTIGLERCPDWFTKNDSDNVPSSQYLLADITAIPFADRTFDGILCCGVLHHISTTERRIRALREMSRLLKIGGKILISVWAFEGRELQSQDVLIKWQRTGLTNMDQKLIRDQMMSRSEMLSSDDNESSSSTCSTAYVNRRAAYESCNSPTSEFGAYYGCAKNTVLNLTPASSPIPHLPHQQSACPESKGQILNELLIHRHSQSVPHSQPCASLNNPPPTTEAKVQSTSTTVIQSSQESEPRRPSLKEQCGSFVSMIRENILSKAIRAPEENQNISSMSAAVGKLLHHISSLPVIGTLSSSSGGGGKRPDEKPAEPAFHNNQGLSCPMPHEGIITNSESTGNQGERDEIGCPETSQPDDRKECEDEVKSLIGSGGTKKTFAKMLQKSLSSDSLDSKKSRQHSLNTDCSMTITTTTTNTTANTSGSTYTSSSSSRLVAYYSMPELRSLERLSESSPDSVRNMRGRRSGGPRLTDLHPITFLDVEEISLPKPEVRRECSQDTEAAIDEMEMLFRSVEISNSSLSDQRDDHRNETLPDFPQVSLCPDASSSICLTIDTEDDVDRKSQRSCSVEYKAKISPSHRKNLRRFSASPNLCVPRTLVQFFQEQNMHETHPSVDSEESFVTVIPAERSCRGSIDVMNMNESDLSYADDVLDENVLSEEFSDVLCESRLATVRLLSPLPEQSCSALSNRSHESVVTPAPASGASTPSPPTKLHRYFHLFRSGELEDLIANNMEGLHLLRSYYSEHATSWCVVCEKVQVWAT
jgi:ubiquinone/menaquinone biosynthesis C-methylase UbiE